MKKIVMFDPALENVNAGDEIISRSIQDLGIEALSGVERLTTHRVLNLEERRQVSRADVVLLGGTNAMSSHMERFRQWLIDPDLARRMRGKLVLLGVGWWQYQEEPCTYTRALLKVILSKEIPQAARDEYTATRLNGLGHATLMTSCPTMWQLPARQSSLSPGGPVVVTVTDYKRNPDVDGRWLKAVYSHFDEVRLIGMGPGDEQYMMEELALSRSDWAGFGVDALDRALAGAKFVGTRLHAGVRALQLGRPALVLAVDNRAVEIARTTRLAVVSREDVDAISATIEEKPLPPLSLPAAAVSEWTTRLNEVVGG